jgi:flagellar protein FliS
MYDSTANLYLEQEVLTASPAKLRWLLLQKSVNLCEVIAELWRSGEFATADQWSLRLREFLTELLGGVQGTDSVAAQVADLYVFMIKELTQAEQSRDRARLANLRELLEIETETWRLVQQNIAGTGGTVVTPPLHPGPLWNATSGSEGSLCVDA